VLTIGLLGGMSWESTAEYYRLINRGVRDRLGGDHSARIIMLSVDFGEISPLLLGGEWAELEAVLVAEARRLRAAGADFLLIATNSRHMFAAAIETASGLEVLHIADPTGFAIQAAGHRRVGLIATRATMEQPFYRERLRDRFGIEVIAPDDEDRATIHRVIFEGTGARHRRPRIARGLPGGHGAAGRVRRRSDRSRLHRNHAAGAARGQHVADVRHHRAPRRSGG
jgi:aspartate racemase